MRPGLCRGGWTQGAGMGEDVFPGNSSNSSRQAMGNCVQQTCFDSLTSWGDFWLAPKSVPQLGSPVSENPTELTSIMVPHPYWCPSGEEASTNRTPQFISHCYPWPTCSLPYILALINLFFFTPLQALHGALTILLCSLCVFSFLC